jgi:NAD(P)-dependent dehydrogenase (short-subunit alcohol dehydrogenase family)
LSGNIESFARTPPTRQATAASLAGKLDPAEFAGSVALVVGGSRGLGELTAKLLARGGAQVVITYRVGRADAEAVAAEIHDAGGLCETLAYEAGQPAAGQLAGLRAPPSHAYYFATPTAIFRPQAPLFAPDRLQSLLKIYVDGFWELAQALRAMRPDVSLFYASSVAVEERPPGMVEYAMAKAAGETLCTELSRSWAPLHVTATRLPRLPTDQTATVTEVTMASPLEILLPVVREVQSWPRAES